MEFRKMITTTYMQDSKRDTERTLDYVGKGEGGQYKRIALKHIYYHM